MTGDFCVVCFKGLNMLDRFQLETEIHDLHVIADELDLIAENLIENDEIDVDETTNALIGVAAVTRMRVAKLFTTFKSVFKLDEYREERECVK